MAEVETKGRMSAIGGKFGSSGLQALRAAELARTKAAATMDEFLSSVAFFTSGTQMCTLLSPLDSPGILAGSRASLDRWRSIWDSSILMLIM